MKVKEYKCTKAMHLIVAYNQRSKRTFDAKPSIHVTKYSYHMCEHYFD